MSLCLFNSFAFCVLRFAFCVLRFYYNLNDSLNNLDINKLLEGASICSLL